MEKLLIQVSAELEVALGDRELYNALCRLRTARRFRELGIPESLESVVQASEKLVEKTRAGLGERWELVEDLYPEFLVWTVEMDKALKAWEDKCILCVHWPEKPPQYDSGDWCAEYSEKENTCPHPCPKYTAKKQFN